MAKASINNNRVDKKLKAISGVAQKDPNEHIELEIMLNLKALYEEAKEGGYKGTFDQYQKTLSDDDVKKIMLKNGGKVS
jgi:hypothetical protein